MSYTLSSLVLCDVTPCDTMWHPYKGWKEHLSASLVLLRLDGSQRHWPRWRPPAGPRHSWTAEHLRKFNERLTFQQISSDFNTCQLSTDCQHISAHQTSYIILPYFALEHIYQTMQKHDSGSMSFLKASLTGGRLSGDDCRPSRAHMPRRGRQSGGTESDRIQGLKLETSRDNCHRL